MLNIELLGYSLSILSKLDHVPSHGIVVLKFFVLFCDLSSRHLVMENEWEVLVSSPSALLLAEILLLCLIESSDKLPREIRLLEANSLQC